MVKRFLALSAAILAIGLSGGCNRGAGNQEEAVRQGVIDYLAKRANLNVTAMNVVKDKAEASGSPHSAAGANPHGGAAPPMGGALPPGHPAVDSTKPKP